MAISTGEVKKIAQLARIELTAEEESYYAETISAVLEYMKILNEVATDGVEPTYQVTGIHDVVRADAARSDSLQTALLAQMPQVELGELVVPAVFTDAEE